MTLSAEIWHIGYFETLVMSDLIISIKLAQLCENN